MFRAATIAALIAIVAVGCRHPLPINELARSFRQTSASADRLLVIDNNSKVAREIADSADARRLRRDLTRLLAADLPAHEGFSCLCYADLVLVWMRGNERLAAIGLQPDQTLSWTDGPVAGDLQLDEASAAELHAQLTAAHAGGATVPEAELPSFE